MALNDIIPFDDGTYMPGTSQFKVPASAGASTTNRIKAGELVFKSLGNTAGYVVTQWTAGIETGSALKPSIGTDYIAGLAMSTSTETATVAGTVDVMPIVPGMTFLVSPYDATLWDTQTEYNALVGSRIKLNYAATTGKITALSTDSSANGLNGCVVEPLDVILHPGKVRFSIRQALMYNS